MDHIFKSDYFDNKKCEILNIRQNESIEVNRNGDLVDKIVIDLIITPRKGLKYININLDNKNGNKKI